MDYLSRRRIICVHGARRRIICVMTLWECESRVIEKDSRNREGSLKGFLRWRFFKSVF